MDGRWVGTGSDGIGRARRALALALLALAVSTALGACGSEKESDEPAARIVREQTANACTAPPMPPGTPTPEGEDPLANVVTPTPQPPDPTATGAPSKTEAEQVTAAIRNFVNCWN